MPAMKVLRFSMAALVASAPGASLSAASRPGPLVHTYSIVARDPRTGELGVAVQSHWFSVGQMVPWVCPGVGAVATQSIVEPAYGPRALDRLAAGEHDGLGRGVARHGARLRGGHGSAVAAAAGRAARRGGTRRLRARAPVGGARRRARRGRAVAAHGRPAR